ncbi:sce7725 family protein [Pseudomonas cichorii]|uniref:sce7725 family protein n=1 Tax=Pseudomonas cichorii TaxID=36746 RepID=UPI001C8A41E2|nr:sce7725 family protein [Pseudomonas cichorii]MBX8531217.1 sce7725 family protein [Pseudomonas cichorii]
MYYPYFRGKQYDLIAIRECADIMARRGFVPILEPVKESLNGVARTIDTVVDAGGSIVLVINPQYGELSRDSSSILELLENSYGQSDSVFAGVLLNESTDLDDIKELLEALDGRRVLFIHAGFRDGADLLSLIEPEGDVAHVFLEKANRRYQRNFSEFERIIVRDGFKKRANRLHPEVEFFSDLHITFEEEGADGFGDFLMVGDEYSEGGGPAYAVAIHLTFIDDDQGDDMFIHHFKSDRFETPTDPAGKFAEAVRKLVAEATDPDTKIYRTRAVQEFIDLHRRGHFPGLGYIKKLSMQHHIEVMASYFHGR